MNPDGRVRIHYRRPPDREQVFDQRVVLERPDVVVTHAESVRLDGAMRIDGRVALEDGSDVVWFTFPDVWHDIGRFHLADGTFTGVYANVLTPLVLGGPVWHTTDLFLDVWLSAAGELHLLDEDEFDVALGKGWIDADTAARAREEADRILTEARSGTWPPAPVQEWTLERVRGGR